LLDDRNKLAASRMSHDDASGNGFIWCGEKRLELVVVDHGLADNLLMLGLADQSYNSQAQEHPIQSR
jgi:hypothetical protein